MAKQMSKLPVDLTLLDEDIKKALREEARKSVLAEMEQDARDEFFSRETEKLRRAKTPADRYVEVTVDMAPYAAFLMLDGTQYYHGYTYKVPFRVACVILEQMQRTWQHQDQIDGRERSNAYRAPLNRKIGMRDAGTRTRGFDTGVAVDAEI